MSATPPATSSNVMATPVSPLCLFPASALPSKNGLELAKLVLSGPPVAPTVDAIVTVEVSGLSDHPHRVKVRQSKVSTLALLRKQVHLMIDGLDNAFSIRPDSRIAISYKDTQGHVFSLPTEDSFELFWQELAAGVGPVLFVVVRDASNGHDASSVSSAASVMSSLGNKNEKQSTVKVQPPPLVSKPGAHSSATKSSSKITPAPPSAAAAVVPLTGFVSTTSTPSDSSASAAVVVDVAWQEQKGRKMPMVGSSSSSSSSSSAVKPTGKSAEESVSTAQKKRPCKYFNHATRNNCFRGADFCDHPHECVDCGGPHPASECNMDNNPEFPFPCTIRWNRTCRAYNRGNSCTRHPSECTEQHVCFHCGENHPSMNRQGNQVCQFQGQFRRSCEPCGLRDIMGDAVMADHVKHADHIANVKRVESLKSQSDDE